jgi:hypothetical protein
VIEWYSYYEWLLRELSDVVNIPIKRLDANVKPTHLSYQWRYGDHFDEVFQNNKSNSNTHTSIIATEFRSDAALSASYLVHCAGDFERGSCCREGGCYRFQSAAEVWMWG